MKKARRWLADHCVDYEFHEYKKRGRGRKRLGQWVKQVGCEALLNRRGTTWRKLDEALKAAIDEAMEHGKSLHVGFKAEE